MTKPLRKHFVRRRDEEMLAFWLVHFRGWDEVNVTVTKIVIAVFLVAPPFHVGDGVALEKKTAAFGELREPVLIAADSRGIGILSGSR